ncbi:MAG: CHAP domain-containing protein [Actinomycetota bacterium]|nr:CHAP domain-containing protein [Actinomycetota bacterium]
MARAEDTPSARAQPAATRRARRRRAAALALFAVLVVGLVAAALSFSTRAALPPLPSTPFRARIVTIAESQLGYHTDPAHSYCNKFSAFWGAGTATACGPGLRSEEWCADFAAWVWREASAQFTYGYSPGDVNAASGSFYLWAVSHGTWHPVGSGYSPQPGDVAVYGLDPRTGTAVHVAIVIGDPPGARGPEVVNGDGDRTGFSVVETGTDQYQADTPGTRSALAGYASPIPPTPSAH